MDKAAAIQAAADAVRAHQKPDADSATLRDMRQKVQAAQNLGASLTDIRDANQNR
ncbi:MULTISPECIES: hypothetical protein [unclassified Streptomyces]|uniref:hypothetical protein n=1 Tax=unclassified Streptomyces TaxID=2593676 RepID=UPI00278C2315|nr:MULTISPECIES: hypothetical protein [unclassified Streptomyces]